MPDSPQSVSHQPTPDEQLWEAFVAGDRTALEALIERHRDGLYWYLVLSMGDQQAAAQQLLRVWELAVQYRGPLTGFDSFKGWIYAVATQNAVPATQHDVMGLTDLLDDVRRARVASPGSDVFYGIRDMLRPVRQPLLLVSLAGLTLEEAAKACNFTVERVERSVAEACRQLSKLLSGGKRSDEV